MINLGEITTLVSAKDHFLKKDSMSIEYKDTRDFQSKELEDLFLSVEWSSGHFPDKLVVAMQKTGSVFSAWDNGKLVGLISSMDDGIINAYVHYLLVRPEYQSRGIGKQLIEMMREHYSSYLRIILIAYDKGVKFYENCGFKKEEDRATMFISTLWT